MHFRRLKYSTVVALAAATIAGVTAPLQAAVPRSGMSHDARIEAAARSSYNFKVHLKGDSIQVASRKGAVTLTGCVANELHRTLAEETVLDLPGVQSVDNRLSINQEVPTPGSDAWLAIKIKTALLYQRNVNASATKVDVKDGVATLSGEASSLAQKELTGEIAQNVEGVRDLKNELRVVERSPRKSLAEKLDDASITAQVKAVLLAHRSTHMLTTKVKTDRGVTTLRGVAHNPAEKDLATRRVSGVHGVKRVENHMTIEPG